jgi:hypothetical protein
LWGGAIAPPGEAALRFVAIMVSTYRHHSAHQGVTLMIGSSEKNTEKADIDSERVDAFF